MKFINPSVEYWPQETGIQGVWKQIAKATRVCYQSKPREGETDEEFVKKVILKPALIEGDLNDLEHCKFDLNKMHGSCLEHSTVYLQIPYFLRNVTKTIEARIKIGFYDNNPYSKVLDRDNIGYITSNLRVIIENNKWADLQYFSELTEYHAKRYTFNVITDIGVTREMNRHRTFSICEQSTRYCDLLKDKFGKELTFIKPTWIENTDYPKATDTNNWYYSACNYAESAYYHLRKHGWKTEQARQVLLLGLKTQAVYTAFADDWKHFLAMRADNVSGKSHPNIQYVANEIKRIAGEKKLW